MPEKFTPIEYPNKKPKDELFALIKSLNQNEKRYVKLFSSHGAGEKQYLKLFDAMEAEEHYEEKEFVKKHSGRSFVKYLAATKRFLKLFILRAMRTYHEERTKEDEVVAHLRNHRFLCEKGLYAAAIKQLNKAKGIAQERHLDLRLLEINELESKHHIEHATKVQGLKGTISQLQKEQKVILERLQVEYLFTNTYHQVFIEYREGSRRELSELIGLKLDALNLESVLRSDSKYTFNSKLYFLLLHVLMAEDRNELEKSRQIYEQIVQIFRSDNRTLEEDLKRYAKALSNYLMSCHQINFYNDFEEKLELLRGLSKKASSSDQKGEVMQNLLLLEILFFMNTGQWERAQGIPEQVRKLFTKHASKVNKAREIILSFNCLVIWFFNEQWGKMRPWIDHILSEKLSGFRKGVLDATWVLEVIYYFEKEEFELVNYLKRSATRKVNSQLHKKLLNFVQKINDAPILEQKAKFLELSAFLHHHLNHSDSNLTAGFSEMYFWSKSRGHGVPILEATKLFPLDK